MIQQNLYKYNTGPAYISIIKRLNLLSVGIMRR